MKIDLQRLLYSPLFQRIIVSISVLTFLLGISLPFFTITKFWFFTEDISILSSIKILFKNNDYFLGCITILFSVLFPVIKYISLFILIWKNYEKKQMRNFLKVGKWSMTEPFALAIFIIMLKVKGFYFLEVELNLGALFFTIAVITGLLCGYFLKQEKEN